eukprot:360312_1
MATSKSVKTISHKLTSIVTNPIIFRSISSRKFCTKETEQFYMSGYQALQKKRANVKLSKLDWKPENLSLEQNRWIRQCKKPHEVVNIVNETLKTQPNQTIMSTIFNCAIRKCVELQAYPQCWSLFVAAKTTNHMNQQMYTTMIWMCLNSPRRVLFDKAFDLYKEMKFSKIAMSNYTYATLINSCAKKLCYEQGVSIWNDMQKDENIIPDISSWNAIIMLYCFNKDMNNASQTYYDMQHKAHIIADNYTYTSLLNGYSTVISHVLKYNIDDVDINEYVIRAESVFDDAIKAWENKSESINYEKENEQRMYVIQAWMNLYASIGDIYSCLMVLKWLLKTNDIVFEYDIKMSKRREKQTREKEKWLYENGVLNNGFYRLKIQIFGIVLKACLNKPKLKEDKLMKLIVELMDIMFNKCNVVLSTDVFGMLFQLYRRMMDTIDIEQVEQLYKDMKSKCKTKPTEREINEYARTYLCFMDYNGASYEEKQAFKNVLMDEFKLLKVTPSIYTKNIFENNNDS